MTEHSGRPSMGCLRSVVMPLVCGLPASGGPRQRRGFGAIFHGLHKASGLSGRRARQADAEVREAPVEDTSSNLGMRESPDGE